MTIDEAGAFVLANSALRPVPLVPEIRLHLADDAFSVWEASERGAGLTGQPPPFLARHVLDHPGLVAGRSVLDLGSGSGITAIAAALAGATAVLASDVDPLARAAIGLNAAANRAEVAVTGDVLDGAGQDADVVLAADVWYERGLADRALGLLRRARDRRARVLVGDVGRAFLPRPMLRELAAYDVPVLAAIEDAGVKRVLVMTLV